MLFRSPQKVRALADTPRMSTSRSRVQLEIPIVQLSEDAQRMLQEQQPKVHNALVATLIPFALVF